MIEKLLIDADLLVWRCGKAAEGDRGGLGAACYNINSQINKMIAKTQICEYKCYLSGVDNFRYGLATLKPYKENRKKLQKPQHYEELRNYLITEWSAEVIDGMEADDALGIEQMKHYFSNEPKPRCTTMICSIDKDLLMIPGWHYNFLKKERTWVSEVEAYRYFYKQVLTGDACDNIPGLKGFGPVAVNKLLDPLTSISDMMHAVNKAYKDSVTKEQLKLKGVTVDTTKISVEDVIEEIKQLLWIRRQ